MTPVVHFIRDTAEMYLSVSQRILESGKHESVARAETNAQLQRVTGATGVNMLTILID